MKRRFIKMHGAGNDYIYFDCLREAEPEDPAALSVRLSDRHKGIGGDGVVLICPSGIADAKMRMFNADGSEGRMCGNAIRCVAKYLFDNVSPKERMAVETLSGVKELTVFAEGGKARSVRVDMGPASFAPASVPVLWEGESVVGAPYAVGGRTFSITCLSMGNPHCVVFADPDGEDLAAIGPLFENAPVFPARVNTEFVRKIGERTLKMRVWERGSGETLACGTGACAAAAAAVKLGLCPAGEEIEVRLRGGTLFVTVGDTVFLRGPAETVFTGEIEL